MAWSPRFGNRTRSQGAAAFLASLLAAGPTIPAAAGAGPAPPHAPTQPPTLQCLALRGPCQAIDTVDVMLPALGPGSDPAPALVANFGLLARDPAGRVRYACEPGLGGLSVRARMSPSGEIFVPDEDGLLHYRPGCAGQPTSGDVVGHVILGVAFDPGDPLRIWALGIDGPSKLYLSRDGGNRFDTETVLPAALPVWQLKGAPSRADTLWAVGERPPGGQLLLVRSDDGGRTFIDVGTSAGATPLPGLPLDLLGIDPQNPEILWVGMRDQNDADAVWRSRDGGHSWQRSLLLPVVESLSGFSFGSDGRTVFVAGTAQADSVGAVPAHLYTSRDGGETWPGPLPSGAAGPRFRCLGYRGNLLYACAGGTTFGDQFLLGSSSDGGQHWSPVITTEQIAGPEPCMGDSCAATSAWLCDSYQLCGGTDAGPPAPGDPGSPAADAAADSAGSRPDSARNGCACGVGRPNGGAPARWPWPLIGLGAGAWARRRRTNSRVAPASGLRRAARLEVM